MQIEESEVSLSLKVYLYSVQYTTTDRCKLTADKVVATSSPLYKLTFFPTYRRHA